MNTGSFARPAAESPAQRFEIRRLGKTFGAEVVGLGLDLGKPLSDEDFARVHRSHLEHHVLVFRDQRITPAQQIAFSRSFGALQIHVLPQYRLADHPEILIVSNIVENGRPVGLGDAGHFWHSDMSYKERPALGTLLHAQEIPAEGGDTVFANMHTAWESLPDHLQRALAGRRAQHSYVAKHAELQARGSSRPKLSEEQLRQVVPVTHPTVRTHPETGRKAIYVSEHFTTRILDTPEDESRQLLDEVFAHSTRPEHLYRHSWAEHDLVFWDNRSLMHLAAGTPAHLRRLLYRTTIEGDVPC